MEVMEKRPNSLKTVARKNGYTGAIHADGPVSRPNGELKPCPVARFVAMLRFSKSIRPGRYNFSSTTPPRIAAQIILKTTADTASGQNALRSVPARLLAFQSCSLCAYRLVCKNSLCSQPRLFFRAPNDKSPRSPAFGTFIVVSEALQNDLTSCPSPCILCG